MNHTLIQLAAAGKLTPTKTLKFQKPDRIKVGEVRWDRLTCVSLLWSCLASFRVASQEHLILPAFAVPISPVAVVALAVVMTVVAAGTVVVIGTLVLVSLSVTPSLVAMAVMVVVVASFLRPGVHGSHVVHSHLRSVAEALMTYRASRPEVRLVKGLRAGQARMTVLLQVTATLTQILPRPFVVFV